MTVTGPEAMRALDDALRDIRREEDEISKRIARATERVGKLRETELGQLRALAAIRLSPETQEELTAVLGRAEHAARELLKEHATSVAALEETLSEREAELSRLTAERQDLLETLETRQGEIDALGDAVEAALGADPEHGALIAARDAAARMAGEAERKTTQAETDREEKGRPYREDALFSYLWDRGYGTTAYRTAGLTRMLDGWVARLIRFHDARPNYANLTAIPEKLRDHAERLAADLAEIEGRIEAQEVEALDKAGGRPAREALAAARARLSAIDTEILAAEDAREQLAEDHKAVADGGDPAFAKAIDVLAEAIGDTAIAQLLADARATRTPDDDTLVVRIEETRRRIGEEETEIEEERARVKTLESRRRELEDIEFEFKKSQYDDPRSRFKDDNLVGDLLTDFLKGGMTAAAYWGMWNRSQNWSGTSGPIVPPNQKRNTRSGGFPLPPGGFSPRPPSGGAWGSGSSGGFSRPRSGPRSGGFGGGGFKTGGGFKGGGFKTGGGF